MKQVEHRCIWANTYKIVPITTKLNNTFICLPHQELKIIQKFWLLRQTKKFQSNNDDKIYLNIYDTFREV